MYVVSRFLMVGSFQSHGYCYQWNAGLMWLHILSDVLISAAYFTIPFVILLSIRKRPDLSFSWMFALFGAFVLTSSNEPAHFHSFKDLEQNVRRQVARIKNHPYVRDIPVRGFVYDVKSGKLSEVTEQRQRSSQQSA